MPGCDKLLSLPAAAKILQANIYKEITRCSQAFHPIYPTATRY